MSPSPKIKRTALPAGDNHQVVTVKGDKGNRYRKTPCSDCPWRTDACGTFPPEAFVHSANTAEDMSSHKFGCHQSGTEKGATCAGFILRGAEHNLAVRMQMAMGNMTDVTTETELYDDYVDMAVANGVDPDHPALQTARRGSYATSSQDEDQ
jgi:hypothetical protein